ncbi:hypothetical protein PENTCL1PPCAC_11425 [Pristionchus entomophagus]|uniref:Translation factor GUF1 homolog, mitochondrial n=1 Tax=Pristionchus entomophagus TaxID=358040 RepID=A0AAV5TA51_9BILA|nr:hypothetical protein PENTCL1PPCAC_11425 [Pristionchus entomophagus]
MLIKVFRCIRSLRLFSSLRPDDPTKTLDLSSFTPDKIRNFGIVAHVDHGKSTLADRLLELAGVIRKGEKEKLLMDALQVEKERGITVKAQTAVLPYKGHLLNLIDTPGHADFTEEVSRSLAVCDGILFLVAANQGVQAQSIANFWLAFERNVTIIPVINKIDIQGVNVHEVETQMKNLFDFNSEEILRISGKSGLNVDGILDKVIEKIPPPTVVQSTQLKALIYDSHFHHFRGAIALILVKEGEIRRGSKIRSFHGDKEYEVQEVGIMRLEMIPVSSLNAGQVGYLICNMKTAAEARVGETLFDLSTPKDTITPFEGFRKVQPTLFAGLFPLESSEYEILKQAVERLALNDSSVVIQPDSSRALGLGWKVGFLGVLHMEVFASRLEQEYDSTVILTQPSVEFRATVKDNETIRKKRYGGEREIRILDASKFPNEGDIEKFMEPMVKVRIVIPSEMLGQVHSIYNESRADVSSIDENRLLLLWRLPLAEVITDFFERLKRVTSGMASFDYEADGYDEANLIKMTISINGKEIPEFSQVVRASTATEKAKRMVRRLREEIPRQQFEVTIKATVGESKKNLASTVIQPMKRDFTQLLKGNFGKGGMERLNKKLGHQKKGKERMKQIGNVQIPKEAFFNVLKN